VGYFYYPPFVLKGFILLKNRYKSEIFEITKAGMLLAVTVVASFLTSTWSPFPKVPFFNARPDFWFGFVIMSLLFLSNKYKVLFLVSVPFALMSSEGSSYAGWGDYFLEMATPMIVLLLMLFVPKGNGSQIIFTIFVFSLYFITRLFFMTWAGVIFWETDWTPSLTYNIWNVTLDYLVSIPFVFIGMLKLIKIKGI